MCVHRLIQLFQDEVDQSLLIEVIEVHSCVYHIVVLAVTYYSPNKQLDCKMGLPMKVKVTGDCVIKNFIIARSLNVTKCYCDVQYRMCK